MSLVQFLPKKLWTCVEPMEPEAAHCLGRSLCPALFEKPSDCFLSISTQTSNQQGSQAKLWFLSCQIRMFPGVLFANFSFFSRPSSILNPISTFTPHFTLPYGLRYLQETQDPPSSPAFLTKWNQISLQGPHFLPLPRSHPYTFSGTWFLIPSPLYFKHISPLYLTALFQNRGNNVK